MSIKMFFKLREAKKELAPGRRFKAELKKTLLAAWDERCGSEKQLRWTCGWRFAVAAIASILAVAMLGTGAYAYNSPKVTEGTTLYPLKIAIEKMEENMKKSPEAKAEFYLKKIKRREAEEEMLLKKGGRVERAREEVERLENKLELLNESEQIKKLRPMREETREKVQERLEQRKRKLEMNIEKMEKRAEILQERKERRRENRLERRENLRDSGIINLNRAKGRMEI